MPREPDAGLSKLAWRGLTKRCPRCGAKAFSSYFTLEERCPSCGLRFEREEGFWVGALIIKTIVTFGTFVVVFAGGILVTWPDVPWVTIGVVTIVVNLIVPVLFYPRSKTLWSGLEMSWHPLEAPEIESADRARANLEPGTRS
jgi:uncharacterized protein (DUF983 family)